MECCNNWRKIRRNDGSNLRLTLAVCRYGPSRIVKNSEDYGSVLLRNYCVVGVTTNLTAGSDALSRPDGQKKKDDTKKSSNTWLTGESTIHIRSSLKYKRFLNGTILRRAYRWEEVSNGRR